MNHFALGNITGKSANANTKTPINMSTNTPSDWKEIADTICKCRTGAMDEKQFRAMVFYHFETLLEEARQDAREEVITYISKDQGWEETEDNYRELFGFAPKYSSL